MKKSNTNKVRTVHFTSLGCPKNTVDTEVMAATLQEKGLEVVPEPADADVIVVNTCSFIGDAKEESVDVLLEMAEYKNQGTCKVLLAAGCLPQRNGQDLQEAMPEIDGMVGTGTIDRIFDAIEGVEVDIHAGEGAHYLQQDGTPRLVVEGQVSAYLKISDGCSRKCSFCAIPGIRGKAESRTIENVVGEARRLAEAGITELNLVAQDTGAYGKDLRDGTNLVGLLEKLNEVEGLRWIRVMYLYPDTLSTALLDAMNRLGKVVPYLDIPIQHASDAMLSAMKRGHDLKKLAASVKRAKKMVPGAFLRTTAMVGFPGETDADVEQLVSFIKEAGFSHLGAFRYSDEEDTAAYEMTPKVSRKDSYNRWRKVMAAQREVVKRHNRAMVGREVEVLVESVEDEGGFVLVGRHAGQAPEIDGITYLVSSEAAIGDIVRAKIIDFKDYDLVAEPI